MRHLNGRRIEDSDEDRRGRTTKSGARALVEKKRLTETKRGSGQRCRDDCPRFSRWHTTRPHHALTRDPRARRGVTSRPSTRGAYTRGAHSRARDVHRRSALRAVGRVESRRRPRASRVGFVGRRRASSRVPIAANVFSHHAHPRVAMKQLFEVTSHPARVRPDAVRLVPQRAVPRRLRHQAPRRRPRSQG